MPTILDRIVEKTREDLITKKHRMHRSDFQDLPRYERERRDFAAALKREGEVNIIAEIKKASPSKGEIRADFDPRRIAEQYQEAGAAALSVLTDEPFFSGSLDYLAMADELVEIPVLRKDFIIDPYQIEEARAYGADAILLIVAIMDGHQLQELHHAAEESGLQCLVECYTQEEMDRTQLGEISILGVNNRDLNTFEVDLHRGVEMLASAPDHLVKVSESGLSSAEDLKVLHSNGIHAALIGEHFMRQDHPGDAVKAMREELLERIEQEKQ